MHHTLNKRDRYETSFNDQEEIPPKLQKRHRDKPQKPKVSTDERRQPTLSDPINDIIPLGIFGITGIIILIIVML